jgi:catechol 2,3-dioxygenase-like lactoylglutathione lyase family enzyme
MSQAHPAGAFNQELLKVPGFLFFDHIAIAVRSGELDKQVEAYQLLGFREIHREEVYGGDQVREALLQVGDGPNLMQIIEPLNQSSPVQWRARRLDPPGFPCTQRPSGVRLYEGGRVQPDRQGSPSGLAWNHGVFHAPEIAQRNSVRVPDRGG